MEIGNSDIDNFSIKSKTTIPLMKVTRQKLITYGKKGETWDELVNRLMDMVDKSKM